MAVPSQPSFIPSAWAENGQYNNIPATQANPGDGSASWATGFPIENTLPVSQGGVPSQYKDFQGVLHALSQFAQFQQAGGIFAWSADIDYPVGAIVIDSGKTYQCIAENGPGTTAGSKSITNTNYWLNVTASNYAPAASVMSLAGNNSMTSSNVLHRNNDTSFIRLSGGGDNNLGANLLMYGGSAESYTGWFYLIAKDTTTSVQLRGKPDGTLTWNGQTIQTSSDERLKTAFSEVPDEILDAWGKVNWQQFKFRADAEEKGMDNCRWHPGLVAQRVKTVFEAEGLDACKYGILCYDEWDDEYEDIEVVDTPESKDENGETIPAVTHTETRLMRKAGDLWTIRYEEALAMEAAYQRRRADRLEAKVSGLEERLARLETLLESDSK